MYPLRSACNTPTPCIRPHCHLYLTAMFATSVAPAVQQAGLLERKPAHHATTDATRSTRARSKAANVFTSVLYIYRLHSMHEERDTKGLGYSNTEGSASLASGA